MSDRIAAAARARPPAHAIRGGLRAALFRFRPLAIVPGAFYSSPMPDADQLTPADPAHFLASLAFALTSDGRLAKSQAAELLAKIVAERIVARLERDGYVIMQKRPAAGHGAGRGP
jgi:hypothetical protein